MPWNPSVSGFHNGDFPRLCTGLAPVRTQPIRPPRLSACKAVSKWPRSQGEPPASPGETRGPRVPEERREAEVKRKPSRTRKGKRTAETEPEPKAASTARSVERRSSGRWGRESGSGCRSSGVWSSRTQVHGGWSPGRRLGGSAKRPAGHTVEARTRSREARSFVPYRDWREEAAGSRKLKAAFLSRLGPGRSKSAARTGEGVS
jgi:hypothetical protein